MSVQEVAYFDFTKGPASSIDSTVATDTDYNFHYDGTTVRITGAHNLRNHKTHPASPF